MEAIPADTSNVARSYVWPPNYNWHAPPPAYLGGSPPFVHRHNVPKRYGKALVRHRHQQLPLRQQQPPMPQELSNPGVFGEASVAAHEDIDPSVSETTMVAVSKDMDPGVSGEASVTVPGDMDPGVPEEPSVADHEDINPSVSESTMVAVSEDMDPGVSGETSVAVYEDVLGLLVDGFNLDNCLPGFLDKCHIINIETSVVLYGENYELLKTTGQLPDNIISVDNSAVKDYCRNGSCLLSDNLQDTQVVIIENSTLQLDSTIANNKSTDPVILDFGDGRRTSQSAPHVSDTEKDDMLLSERLEEKRRKSKDPTQVPSNNNPSENTSDRPTKVKNKREFISERKARGGSYACIIEGQ